ncbi:hypothetical protein [Motilibacter deserti]|uniref:Uncharacterized protein n=1 Tax=Motilibacter deserti TaxID=2714956 RepID=A0ABX0GZ41_9ACTN|nr:hypothetical protein [Motilibacter deserti]NHC15396.1 hypothetical protein [Motilibacter deserti]
MRSHEVEKHPVAWPTCHCEACWNDYVCPPALTKLLRYGLAGAAAVAGALWAVL